jgi:hypothetical protein
MKHAEKAICCIDAALAEIESAIKEDPAHIDWYLAAKEKLISADSYLTYCIED